MPILGTVASQFSGKSFGSFESIATATGTGSSNTITFNSIPSTYKHLQIRMITKTSDSGSASATATMYFNNLNTGTGYAWHAMEADGANVTPWRGSGLSSFFVGGNSTSWIPYSGFTNNVGAGIIDIYDYASTSKAKTVKIIVGSVVSTTNGVIKVGSGLSTTTSAISSISFVNGATAWGTATSIALYGIKGE